MDFCGLLLFHFRVHTPIVSFKGSNRWWQNFKWIGVRGPNFDKNKELVSGFETFFLLN
jgi:hypothetical protein